MATPTSSSNRSKRKGTKPITQGQNPQRANRQKVSNANVTNAGQRTNTGSAKVTRGAASTTSLPTTNSRTTQNTVTRARAMVHPDVKPTRFLPNSERRGINLPQAANNAMPPKNGPSLRGTTPVPRTTAPTKPSGSFKAPSIPKPIANSLKGASLLRQIASGGGPIGIGSTAGSLLGEALVQGRRAIAAAQPPRPKAKPEMTAAQNRGAVRLGLAQPSDVGNKTSGSAGKTQSPKPKQNPPAKPKPPAPTQNLGGSTPARSGNSAPSAPRRQPAGPAPDAGMKNQDKNYRGNLFEKTFGYKSGQAPDQQKSKFKSVDNKFGQDSGYQPQTKVDGSKYADKKPDMKKVSEYDRLRRKYYD